MIAPPSPNRGVVVAHAGHARGHADHDRPGARARGVWWWRRWRHLRRRAAAVARRAAPLRSRDLGLQRRGGLRSEEHTSELQSQSNLVCRLLLEKKKKKNISPKTIYIDTEG